MQYLYVLLSVLMATCSSQKNSPGNSDATKASPSKVDSTPVSSQTKATGNTSEETTPSDSKAKQGSAASGASIQISTTHAVPLYKDIHSACTIDIFFGKGMKPRDILSDPYFSFVKALNFNSLQYSGGSTADYDHVMVGDTHISGGKGDGYNIREEDLRDRGEDISSAFGGVGKIHFGKDFFNEYCALLNKLSIHGDIIANVQDGTLEELLWKIDQAHAKRVIFGMEQNLTSNERDFPDGNAYKGKIVKWIEAVKRKYPNVITVIDAAPIYKSTAKFDAWNDQVRSMPGEEMRLYLWDKDAVTWQVDDNQNLAAMDKVFSNTFPHWFDLFQNKFPAKKISIWQWGIKPKSEVNNSMLACLYIGKFYQFIIDYNKANANVVAYASFMSLKSLNRGDGEISNHYYAFKTCGMLFRGNKRVLDLTLNGLGGVSGVACDENGKYSLLLINESGNQVSIPTVTVDNNSISGKQFTITAVSASSPGSTSVSSDTKTSSSISLQPWSVNMVEF